MGTVNKSNSTNCAKRQDENKLLAPFLGGGRGDKSDKQVLGARDWCVLVSLAIYYVDKSGIYSIYDLRLFVCCRPLIAQSHDTYYYFALAATLFYFGFLALSGRCFL